MNRPSESCPDLESKAEYNFAFIHIQYPQKFGTSYIQKYQKGNVDGEGEWAWGQHTEMHWDVQYLGVCFKNLSANIRYAHMYRLEITAE